MLVFPQLSTGASAQYPILKQFSQRSLQSAMEDGTLVVLPDSDGDYLRWRIAFRDLSDQEAGSLSDFFAATQGSLLPFLYLDPTANLLRWSEDYSRSCWTTAGISLESDILDPIGGSCASRATNNGAMPLVIAQDTQIPGLVQACFSVYLQAVAPLSVTLSRKAAGQSQDITVLVGSHWQRFSVSGSLPSVSDASQFAITVPAGASVDLFGAQVDAQLNPSEYVLGEGIGGVYTAARFDMRRLNVTATGPNRNDCVVSVRANLPAGE